MLHTIASILIRRTVGERLCGVFTVQSSTHGSLRRLTIITPLSSSAAHKMYLEFLALLQTVIRYRP